MALSSSDVAHPLAYMIRVISVSAACHCGLRFMLEPAIARSGMAREVKQIELKAHEEPGDGR
jgi:hypothetical protein